MADPDFWRDLAKDFRALDPSGMLRADWDYIVGSGNLDQWRLTGANRSITVQFEALARRAGRALSPAETRDPLLIWLSVLRNTLSFNFGAEATEKNADGSDGAHHVFGTIQRLCTASADLCTEMESEALKQPAPALNHPESDDALLLTPEEGIARVLATRATPEFIATREALRTIRTYIDPEEASEAEVRFADEYIRGAQQTTQAHPAEIPYLSIKPKQDISPTKLRDEYLASFGEKVIILDICWAAKQRYREWTRWIGGHLKSGSKPDMAFRAVLTSGRRPEEYRTEPRPKSWK